MRILGVEEQKELMELMDQKVYINDLKKNLTPSLKIAMPDALESQFYTYVIV